MSKHSLCNRIMHKIDEKTIHFLGPLRRKMINNHDFTIFSNNCWGGKCYEFFELKKQSPTIGAYFFAEDYIKFVYNLKHYLECPIQMITAEQSKHFKDLEQKNQLNIPIGKLDDIEIIFLHYKDPKVAKEKWIRRVDRVNYNNIILKFSFMNNCNDELIQKFENIKGVKKILFLSKSNPNAKDGIIVPSNSGESIDDDTYNWRKYINIYKIINSKKTSFNDMKIIK